ncbi:MAG: VCBS repeat-containing protein [Bacteroidia bacterium]
MWSLKSLSFILLVMGLCVQLAGQTRFQSLTPEQSGIDFNNLLTEEKDHNILIYSNYYGGGGVGIGDFNNDGLQDVFFAGNLVSDRLYLNQGDMAFREATKESGIVDNGGWSSGVILADVNQDGWLDIYVTRELYDDQPELRANALYINLGEQTTDDGRKIIRFEDQASVYGIADTARTRHASFLDFDRDGDLDLFLLNQPPNPGNYSELYGADLTQEAYRPRLYRNDGQSFTDVSAEARVLEPGYANSASTVDVNNDGWVDIYLANDFDQPDRLYINQKDGTFRNVIYESMRHISYYSMGVDAADINRDGWLDLMVLDMVAEDNYRLKANMSGMNPASFWKTVNQGGHYQYMFNALHLNQGIVGEHKLHFSEIGQMAGVPSTDWSWSNLFADFDNDGWQDLYVTNGLLRDIRNTDAANTFPAYVQRKADEYIRKNPNAGDVSIWDVLDLDEAMKLIPSEPLANYAFRNNGDLSFSKVMQDWGLNEPSFSNGSAYGDLDNDGDLDLVVSNLNTPAFVYRNMSQEQGDKAHYLRFKPDMAQPFGTRITIHYGDEQQMQELTNIRGMYSTSEAILHFGLGDYQGTVDIDIHWPDGSEEKRSLAKLDQQISIKPEDPKAATEGVFKPVFADVTDALKLDFQHQENQFDDYFLQVLLPHKMSQFGPAIASADVNGDGLEDFYVGGALLNEAILYLQKSNGQYQAKAQSAFKIDRKQEDVHALFLDVEGDGDQDLYVVSGGNEFPAGALEYSDRLYLNDGKGNFTSSQALPPMYSSGGRVSAGDFDIDGDLDLFIGGRHMPGEYPTAASSYLLRNDSQAGIAKFTDISAEVKGDLAAFGMCTDAKWMDYDGNGYLDLIAVGEWQEIIVLAHSENGFTQKTLTENTRGWWYSIESADLDGDGDEDLITGNLGENYKYHASEGEPFSVHYEDFDANGQKDIVLSYYNFGERVPLRGKSCSSEQVPMLKKDFPTYDLFASANLEDVYNPDKLADALSYEVESFASCWWENQGEGKFVKHLLPREAQMAPINDILIKDFDQDGIQDIVIGGNLFVSEIETPRADAGVGLFLRGLGEGDFEAVPTMLSGLFLPYDVKHIIPLGNDKFLVACNDDRLRVISY